MRILQVCSGVGEFQGGAEQICVGLSDGLKNSGNEVVLLTGRTSLSYKSKGLIIPTAEIPEAKNLLVRKACCDYFNPFAISQFKKHVTYFRPNVVHFHSLYGLSTTLVAIAQNYCPAIVTLHDAWLAFTDSGVWTPKFGLANSYLKVPQGYVHRRINRHLVRGATLVSPSRWLIEFFEEAGFGTPRYIPNGLDRKGAITKYQRIVLWVGSLTTFKGLPRVIGVVAPIVKELGWRFVVIGEGPHKAKLGESFPEVEFLGFQNPIPYYEKASILVVSSLGKDNFPTVILEAMRHGVCVVGHRVGGIPELIGHNRTGLLYENNQELKESITVLTSDERQIRKFGNAGRKRFLDNYLFETCRKKYTDLYHSLTTAA